MEDLPPLPLEKQGSALTFDSVEGRDGQHRVLVLWTTPTEGTLPLIALERDQAFQALDWITRWLTQHPR